MESIQATEVILGSLTCSFLYFSYWTISTVSDLKEGRDRDFKHTTASIRNLNSLLYRVRDLENQIAEPKDLTKEQLEEELGYKINIVQEKTNG